MKKFLPLTLIVSVIFLTFLAFMLKINNLNLFSIANIAHGDDDEDEEEDDEGEDDEEDSGTKTITTYEKLSDTISKTTTITTKNDSDGDGVFDDEDDYPRVNNFFIVKDENLNGIDDKYEN